MATVGREEPGRYRLLRELARGGQGIVSVAWDSYLGREVAFKQLRGPDCRVPSPNLSAAEARFVREARITAQLDHPGIAPLHEVGLRADGSLYATQRLIAGITFTAALDGCASLPQRLAMMGAFISVCETMAWAHSRGVIHRDLKPDNVMITSQGSAVVLDWGLGRIGATDPQASDADGEAIALTDLEGNWTQDGQVLGTPAYMSPEQASGNPLATDCRSDVWSLGVMLYRILTGRLPFEGTSRQDLLAAIISARVPPVREVCPDVPAPLAAIAERAMSRDPDARHADAGALVGELEAWVRSSDDVTPAETRTRRARSSVVVAMLASLAILVGIRGAWPGAPSELDGDARAPRPLPVATTSSVALTSEAPTARLAMGAWLGISGQDLSPRMAAAMDLPSSDGVLVTGVEPGSPADSARVLPEDVITDLDAERIRYFGQLMTKVSSLPPNSTVTLGFSRQGRRLEARVRLGQRSVALPPQPTLGAPVTTSVLGLVLEAVDPSTSELTGLPPYGALVKEVTPGSAAARAEVVLGTVIVEVDRKPVRSPEDVRRELGALSGAAPVLLKVQVRGSRNQASYHLLEPR